MSKTYIHLLTIISFFSRIPITRLLRSSSNTQLPLLSQSVHMLPIGAIIITMPSLFVFFLITDSSLPSVTTASMIIFINGIITGFMHEDGLCDSADGLLCDKQTKERLRIMRDSSVGAFGATTLVLTIIMKVATLGSIIDEHHFKSAIIIVAAAVISRINMLLVWTALPPADSSGLSSCVGQPSITNTRLAIIWTALIMFVPVFIIGLANMIAAIILSAMISIYVGLLARRRLYGHTGDVLGATQQLSELMFLIGISI